MSASTSNSATAASSNSTRNRLMALEALRQDPTRWAALSLEWKNDKEFVLMELEHATTLPDKSVLERLFDDNLRCDRDVVLAFCKRSDFAQLYTDRLLFVPDALKDDKDVMMEYCRQIPRSLQECSERLCGDYDVVETAVKLDGLELQYASRQLQEDKDLVVLACQSNGRALEFCPAGPVRDALTSNREFMMTVLSSQQGGPMYRLLPAESPLRLDRELLLLALGHGLRWRYCPEDYQQDQEFLLEAVTNKAELYLELPRPIQLNRNVARAAVTAESANHAVFSKAVAQIPALKHDTQVILSIARRGETGYVRNLFLENETAFKDDKDIMMAILNKDRTLFAYCSNRLRLDPDIVMAAIDDVTAIDIIQAVTAELLEEHTGIFVKAIQVSHKDNLKHFPTHVKSARVWGDRHVALAWVRRGCAVRGSFAGLLLADRVLALEVAKHSWHDFGMVGTVLRADRGFMLQAIERNGRVLRHASLALRQDLSVVVRAVAQTSHAISTTPGFETVTKEALEVYLQDQLALYQTFVYDFLAGIAISRPNLAPAHRSPLTFLDRGTETTQALKRNIADFVGVPRGKDLALIRRASYNLANPTPEDPQDQNRRADPFDLLGARHLREVLFPNGGDADRPQVEFEFFAAGAAAERQEDDFQGFGGQRRAPGGGMGLRIVFHRNGAAGAAAGANDINAAAAPLARRAERRAERMRHPYMLNQPELPPPPPLRPLGVVHVRDAQVNRGAAAAGQEHNPVEFGLPHGGGRFGVLQQDANIMDVAAEMFPRGHHDAAVAARQFDFRAERERLAALHGLAGRAVAEEAAAVDAAIVIPPEQRIAQMNAALARQRARQAEENAGVDMNGMMRELEEMGRHNVRFGDGLAAPGPADDQAHMIDRIRQLRRETDPVINRNVPPPAIPVRPFRRGPEAPQAGPHPEPAHLFAEMGVRNPFEAVDLVHPRMDPPANPS